MKREMEEYGLPEPEFYEERGSFKVVFRNINLQSDTQSDTQSNTQSKKLNKILEYCMEPKTAKEIRDYIGIKSKSYVALNIIKPLIDSNKLEYTNKNSINARNQKYVTIKNNPNKKKD